MKKLFNDVKASLSKSTIYSNPEGVSAKTAIGYMAKLTLVLVAIKTIIFCIAFVPIASELRIIAGEMIAKYPTDLTLSITDGSLSMNKKNPFIIPTPAEKSTGSTHKNLIVIDTSKTIDFNALSSYDTSILLTKDGYMTIDGSGLIKAQSFKKFPNYTLSKTSLDSFKNNIDSLLGNKLWILTIMMGIVMLIGLYAVGFVGALFWSLAGTLGALIITKTKNYSLSFSKLYGLSMYAYTAVLAFGIINIFIKLPSWVGALIFLAILAGFMDKKAENASIA